MLNDLHAYQIKFDKILQESSGLRMLVSMLVETVNLNPYPENSFRISFALSGWQTMVVRASGVNNWLMYFWPTETISSMVTLLTWRIFDWFKSVIRLVPLKQVDMKFWETTASILFSRSTNSNINELRADSNNAGSHDESGNSCASCNQWNKTFELPFSYEMESCEF